MASALVSGRADADRGHQKELRTESASADGDTEGADDPSTLFDEPEDPRNLAAFFVFGLINNFAYVVFLSAAEHIFEDHSGAVLLVNATPGLVVKCLYGFGMYTLPYGLRISAVAVVPFVMFHVVASAQQRWLRLAAIAFVSLVGGLGETSFLSLTALYKPATIGMWSSGTGGAGIFGAGFYFLMTVVLGLSPQTTLRLSSPIPLLLILTFYTVLRTRTNQSVTEAPPALLSVRAFRDKLPLLSRLFFRFMLPLMLVYYFEYTINQGVLPVIDFVTTRLPAVANDAGGVDAETPAADSGRNWDLYVTYQLLYQLGVFVSRSSISFVKIRRLWLLVALQAVNLALLVVVATKELVSSAWIIFAMILWEGLLGGAAYVNCFWSVSQESPSTEREWALGVTSVADTIGITLSAVTAVFLECALRRARGMECH